ncbi:hypothetical protein [Lapidilactobacillus bayanensis]|uniref:hypothetical protein n=1 Tax=Lapidilactobacillus bayanensis TaxID=2485998 RepID=UPI000F7A5D83|nr:hypothetical protein [Lapidilactobacillus bayanensis]
MLTILSLLPTSLSNDDNLDILLGAQLFKSLSKKLNCLFSNILSNGASVADKEGVQMMSGLVKC